MAEVYILSSIGKLGKRDTSLVFYKPDGTEQILYPFKIKQLLLVGKISISGDAFRILAKNRIPVSFISENGYFNSRLVYANEKNVFLRQAQYRIMDNAEQSLQIAKDIVIGKIKNQISFMHRIKRKNNFEFEKIKNAILKTKELIKKAETVESIDVLRGIEGNASKNYFSVFKCNISPEWADFPCRSKNPPRSNVNAVLSFLYTILMTRVETAIESHGLDTMAGTLHASRYGASSLVFDLTEEFRVPIADTVCCNLFNLGILKQTDFESKLFNSDDYDYPSQEKEDDAVLLTEDGLTKVVDAFEEKMYKDSIRTKSGKNLSYGKLIYRQIGSYKKMLNGERSNYKPFYFK